MMRFISYSGGIESTTMLLLFPDAIPIFADTGWEHAAMYRWLEEIEAKTGREIVRVRKGGRTLPEQIEDGAFYPSPRARFCTREFKIEPIDEYLSGRVPCEVMIGLNADETDMRTGNHGLLPGVIYSYPLVKLGMGRAACVALLDARGLRPQFPRYMKRGGCVGCFFKSKREYALMARESPQEAYSVADLEDAIQDIRGNRYGVRDGIKNMRRFLDDARRVQSFDFASEAELVSPTPCGVFCHR